MGNTHTCTSKGALLLLAAANGDVVAAQELLKKHPKAALYHNFKDKSSPLIQAAARGHFELVQLLLETAVMTEGPDKAKKYTIDHANIKRQTALMVACKHGHPDCVEYLVANGADALLTDERRHNTCLHFAALYGHSDCVHKLLSCRTNHRSQGRQIAVAQIPCTDEDDTPNIKFIDRHNGWGLTALHIAVFQGSVNTVRALLRHGANLEAVITPSRVENSPIRCAVGSNALHIAALIGNIVMAKLILEAQESCPGLELRSMTDSAGMKPQEYAQRARNPVLMHLLDERLPVSLLRQIWMNYSLEHSVPPRHQTLGSLLQKLKLMFNLEIIAAQRNLAAISSDASLQQPPGQATNPAATAAAAAEGGGASQAPHSPRAVTPSAGSLTSGAVGNSNTSLPLPDRLKNRHLEHSGSAKQVWDKRLHDVQLLLASVDNLHSHLNKLCTRETQDTAANSGWPNQQSHTHEAVLDFILSTLITPRTVSAVLHAAKKIVSSSVMTAPLTQSQETETQHGISLITTALRAVETCLHAATYLSNPGALDAILPSLLSSNGAASSTQAGVESNMGAGRDSPRSLFPGLPTLVLPPSPRALHSLTSQVLGSPRALQQLQQQQQQQHVLLQASTHGQGASQLPGAPGEEAPPQPIQAANPAVSHLLSTMAPNAQFLLPRPDDSNAAAAFATHWSAHLHTLIAQLQWDIGIQRHRRRRQHAQAAAARAAARAESASAATVVPAGGATITGDMPVDGAAGVRQNPPASPSGAPNSSRQSSYLAAGMANAAARRQAMQSPVAVPALSSAASQPTVSQEQRTEAAAGNVNEGASDFSGSMPPAVDLEVASNTEIGPTHGRAASGAHGAAEDEGPVGTGQELSSPRDKCGKAGQSKADAMASVHDIALGMEDGSSISSDDESMVCSICMDLPVAVLVANCHHGLCVQCAFQLTVKGRDLPCCPFCRQKIGGFEAKPVSPGGNAASADCPTA